MSYAEATTVPFERSISEIITLIKRSGAGQIGQFEGDHDFTVQFTISDRMIRFRLPFPTLAEIPKVDGRGSGMTAKQRGDRLAQAQRQRGRALLLVIKAKLESVESGIETLEQAFLANVVMADGKTVYERIAEPIALEYRTTQPSAHGLLPGPGASA